jgi:hypothetical protein
MITQHVLNPYSRTQKPSNFYSYTMLAALMESILFEVTELLNMHVGSNGQSISLEKQVHGERYDNIDNTSW